MQNLYREYRDRASFLTVYVKEAHPLDEWQMESNEEQGVCYPQPVTLEDRVHIARDFIARCEVEIPFAIDGIENAADELYAAWPERLYVIETDGTIAYKGKTGPFGYHPEEVAAWLMKRFPPEAMPADTSAIASVASNDRAWAVTNEPFALTALECVGERERWRVAIDRSGHASIGRGASAKTVELDAARMRELRDALDAQRFFAWTEASGTPSVDGRVRSLWVEHAGRVKIVHAYSAVETAGHDAAARALDSARFDVVWDLVKSVEP